MPARYWMECFADDARIEADELEMLEERFVTHAGDNHDWPYPDTALRNYARNYAEANERLTGSTDRLDEIGEVVIHPVDEHRIDDWLRFFDHDAFAGNPDWASCYCLSPHRPPEENDAEGPWREIRAAMIDRLRTGTTYGYLAYVEGIPAGWVNASMRADYELFRELDAVGPDPVEVVGVSCFIVSPPYRRHGLTKMLLDRVVEDAAERGATWVEGYPRNSPEGDPDHFRGPRSIYEAAHFTLVEKRDRDAVMRRPVSTTEVHD